MLKYGLTAAVDCAVSRGPAERRNCPTGTIASRKTSPVRPVSPPIMTRVWHSSGWSAAGIVVVGAVMDAAIAPTTGFASDLPAATPAAAQAASVPAAPDWIVTIGGELPHRAKVGRRAGRHLPPN